MKLKKALRGYYREQVAAVKLSGRYAMPASGLGRSGTLAFSVAFHTVLAVLIAAAMISGAYRPSLLKSRMMVITENYDLDYKVTKFLDTLIQDIKNNRSEGGGL